MARTAVFKSESDDGPDIMRWADRMLIKLVGIDFPLIFYEPLKKKVSSSCHELWKEGLMC